MEDGEKKDFFGLEIPRSEIHLLKRIGVDDSGKSKGRWSQVYKGRCYGMDVVVKVPIDISDSKLDDFLNEVKLLSKIHHPNICLFLGASLQPPVYYLVTELLDTDLSTFLKTEKDLSLFQRLKLSRGVCLGMIIVHQNHIIHRDLKPENCLIDRQTGHVKIADFGYSTLRTGMSSKRQCGTLMYMAPEIMKGEDYDEKVDVYSFAMLLITILTCSDPYDRTSFKGVQDFVVWVTDGRRPTIPPNAPPGLVELLKKCWDPDPHSRPTFQEIEMKLSYVLIESAIPNNSTRQLWLDHFGPKLKIGWTTFSNSFFEGFVKAEKALYDEHEIVSSTPLVGAPSDAQISSASQQVLEKWSKVILSDWKKQLRICSCGSSSLLSEDSLSLSFSFSEPISSLFSIESPSSSSAATPSPPVTSPAASSSVSFMSNQLWSQSKDEMPSSSTSLPATSSNPFSNQPLFLTPSPSSLSPVPPSLFPSPPTSPPVVPASICTQCKRSTNTYQTQSKRYLKEVAKRTSITRQLCLKALLFSSGIKEKKKEEREGVDSQKKEGGGDTEREHFVGVEIFGSLDRLFGPCSDGVVMLDRMVDLLKANFNFQGPVRKEECYNLLQGESVGKFLLRFSSNYSGFAISFVRVSASSGKQSIAHVRIQQQPGGFSLPTENKVFPKVNELIDYLLEKGKLQPTYLPSRYGYIFRDKFASAGDYLLAGYAGRSDLFSVGETVPRDEGGDGERRKEENQEEEREAKRRRIE